MLYDIMKIEKQTWKEITRKKRKWWRKKKTKGISFPLTGKVSPFTSALVVNSFFSKLSKLLYPQNVNKTVRRSHSLCYNRKGDSGFVPVSLTKCHLSWATPWEKWTAPFLRGWVWPYMGRRVFPNIQLAVLRNESSVSVIRQTGRQRWEEDINYVTAGPERGCTVWATFRRADSIRLIWPL